ncbi:hypothetical protein TIFTF001_054971 [Ficus carica]|uniref:Uncharacterized protein n=1 Tax=Ficus carica TaxID=3494 RepID=A0AA88ELU3_FICCA|nr:hypothetical protein TIFTF001_054970 [Ficus carica]GMN74146.1 hypothetical protein TIFTF001_054971 [Ficus carica]
MSRGMATTIWRIRPRAPLQLLPPIRSEVCDPMLLWIFPPSLAVAICGIVLRWLSEARPQRLWKCDLDITARFVSVARVWMTRPFVGHGLNGTAAGRDLRSSGRGENETSNNIESVSSSSSPVTGRRR